MKYITSVATALFALSSSTAFAQLIQSKPFALVLQSTTAKYVGLTLASCHEGAAIEALCVAGPLTAKSQTYTYNTTNDEPKGVKYGLLTYELQGGNFNLSEALTFFYDPSTNVALPLFEPGSDNVQPVDFDKNNLMYIESYLNDTVTPPTDETGTKYYRWYVCESNFEGYVYTTLNWVAGKYPPQNPSCVSVGVKRKFV